MTSDVLTPQLVLKDCIRRLVDSPGVYRFYNQKNELLYVGKARNLKKRVSSYLRNQASARVAAIVSQINHINITLTQTENDALLLESNLIKSLKPHYNVLLRDDKSYPYLILSAHKEYPRLYSYRGKPRYQAEYFGPYPNVLAMRAALNVLQKLFKLRPCRDTFFKNRVRPCLQYQIQRCTAPCVGFISPKDYQQLVEKVRLLLNGKSHTVIRQLTQQMEIASSEQRYEDAAQLCTEISAISQIQTQQAVMNANGVNVDVLVLTSQSSVDCIYVLSIRNGQTLGGHAYFPKVPHFLKESTILSQFMSQFYLDTTQILPQKILVNHPIDDQLWLANALFKQHNTKTTISHRVKKTEHPWLTLAQKNAQQALEQALRTQQHQQTQHASLQKALNLSKPPERLECFDISHIKGEATIASCVVFNTEGPSKKDYRRFNINNITPGDDYAAIKQALIRRYRRADQTMPFPDIVIIDGGKGQLTQAAAVLKDLQLKLYLIGIAKGPDRKPGEETLFLGEQKIPVTLPKDSPALHLLQQIRDEAHRFARMHHIRKRALTRRLSILDAIKGIGPKRRQQLLTQFGGLQHLKRASLYELQQVPGITLTIAENIQATLKELGG